VRAAKKACEVERIESHSFQYQNCQQCALVAAKDSWFRCFQQCFFFVLCVSGTLPNTCCEGKGFFAKKQANGGKIFLLSE